jgi:hypothetical protein
MNKVTQNHLTEDHDAARMHVMMAVEVVRGSATESENTPHMPTFRFTWTFYGWQL